MSMNIQFLIKSEEVFNADHYGVGRYLTRKRVKPLPSGRGRIAHRPVYRAINEVYLVAQYIALALR